jgi:hypothetical protein
LRGVDPQKQGVRMRKGTNTSQREELGEDGVEGLLGDEASRTFVLYVRHN